MALEYVEGIDVVSYNKLRDEVGWGALHEEQAESALAHSSYVVACHEEEKIVGSARVIFDGGYVAYIADVMVLPEYQRQGIGKGLMERIMDYIQTQRQEGWKIMVVLVAAKGKEAFYKKFGFEERPNEDRGAGMSQWIR